jgi:hypothetical protein
MKKRITIIAAALALLTLTAASTAAAAPVYQSASGVLVRQDDGYLIRGTLRNDDSQVVGTIHGTLTELTTGFNTCPFVSVGAALCGPFRPGIPPYTCNLLGGDVTLNFRGTIYDALVAVDAIGHIQSAICQDPGNPTSYRLAVFMWSTSHVPTGDFPDIFTLVATSVQQINPAVWKWSS